MLKTTTAMMLLLLLTGCAGMPSFRMQQSQGLTGCLQSEMTFKDLTDPHYPQGSAPWIIECRGKTFLCAQQGEATAACHER